MPNHDVNIIIFAVQENCTEYASYPDRRMALIQSIIQSYASQLVGMVKTNHLDTTLQLITAWLSKEKTTAKEAVFMIDIINTVSVKTGPSASNGYTRMKALIDELSKSKTTSPRRLDLFSQSLPNAATAINAELPSPRKITI